MDKKNLTIGLLLLVAAGVVLYLTPKPPPSPRPDRPPASQAANANQPATATGAATTADATATGASAYAQSGAQAAAALAPAGDATHSSGLVKETADAQITTLSNDCIEARFTNHGGAIVNIAFKKFPAALGRPEPFVFNEQHIDPIFAFTSDAFTAGRLDRKATYKLESSTATEIVYSAIFEDGANRVEVRRRYSIEPANAATKTGDPYLIHHEVTFTNLTDHAVPLPAFAFNIGTAALVSEHDNGMFLSAAHNNGEKTEFLSRSQFGGGSGFLGMNPSAPIPFIEAPGKTVWAAVSNQFFAGILTPETPGSGIVAHRVELPPLPGMTTPSLGLSVAFNYAVPALAPNAAAKLGFDYYAGPKEYTRISQFRQSQDDIMQYNSNWYYRITLGGFLAPMMNILMNYMHGFFGNWGLAIIGMTLLLKIITIPFTLSASRSARRMQKIQPEMQAVREKYKDNPQKMNQAQMEIWKKHKINPMSSCLPMLITMPLFVAFFNMLRSAAELRFQGFLWAPDLSAPDTIGHVPGIGWAINIFPLLATGAMILQMNLVPQPTTDNAQSRMMKWVMPLIMLFIYYFFSCALSLYSTVNGVFMVAQQLIINRLRDTGDPMDAAAPSGGRPMKNVTPARKKR